MWVTGAVAGGGVAPLMLLRLSRDDGANHYLNRPAGKNSAWAPSNEAVHLVVFYMIFCQSRIPSHLVLSMLFSTDDRRYAISTGTRSSRLVRGVGH